jgi:hypothetical protein
MRALAPAQQALDGLNLVYVERTEQSAGAVPVVAERTLWSRSPI